MGNILCRLREEKGMSQKQLARGITSIATLSRIESGEKEGEWLLLQALFQRLGKSIDKFELVVPYEEYCLYHLRIEIIRKMIEGKEAEQDLEEYRGMIDTEKRLHWQSYLELKAVNVFLQTKDAKQCRKQLIEALEITFGEWRNENWKDSNLCIQELEIMLMVLFLSENVLERLEDMAGYIDQRFTDQEERVKIYPKAMWILAQNYIAVRREEEAYKILCLAEQCLVENGVLTCMDRILELELVCLEAKGNRDRKLQKEKLLEAIYFVEKMAEEYVCTNPLMLLLLSSQQGELITSNELIKELRVAHGLSQAEWNGIWEQEALSRIERGRRSPNRKKFHQFLKEMNVQQGTCCGFIVVDDYALYEKVRAYNRAVGRREYEKAESLWIELKEQLDLSQVLNRQFLEAMEIDSGQCKLEEIEHRIHELKKILAYTMPEYEGRLQRIPFRLEFIILNKIAICYKRMKEYDQAIVIYEQIRQKYKDSCVLGRYHVVPQALLYCNYTALLENANCLEEAESVGEEGIRQMVMFQRGDFAGEILANLSCVYDKIPEKMDKAEAYLRYSYYLLSLYGENVEILKDAYEKKYQRVLE